MRGSLGLGGLENGGPGLRCCRRALSVEKRGLGGFLRPVSTIVTGLARLFAPTLRILDWRIGGAIAGRTDGGGLCSSSVLLRLESPGWGITLGLGGAGRWLASSSMARLGGLAGFGCGVLMDRPNG